MLVLGVIVKIVGLLLLAWATFGVLVAFILGWRGQRG